MREIAEHIRALDDLKKISDEDEKERVRGEINARVREALRRDAGAKAYLQNLPICEAEHAFVAMALVEALAVDPKDEDVRLLEWYFDVAARKVAECGDRSRATRVLASYAFLEHGSGTRKWNLLQRYLALTRSPVAALRRAAVDLLGGFEVASAPGVREELVRLLRDDDWPVRRAAEDLLREEGVLPEGYKPSLLDRMRRLR